MVRLLERDRLAVGGAGGTPGRGAATDANAPRPNVDRLLTADELAERLGMKTEWVWAQARAGTIPHVRLGRYRRFRESAVEEWLRELETGGVQRASGGQSRPIPLRRRA